MMKLHVRYHFLIFLFSVFFVLLDSSSAFAAGRTFIDSFDNTSAWGTDGTRNRCNVVASATDGGVGPRTGSSMLRCNWNGVAEWFAPDSYETLHLNSFNFTGGTEVFVRFYVRVDNNAKDHPVNGPKILRFQASNGESYWAMNFSGGSASGALYNGSGSQIGGTFWGGSSSLANGQWHALEFYIKSGVSDGVSRYWEDDVMQWEAVNVNTTHPGGAAGWAPFYITSNWSGAPGCCDHDTTNYLYWDDFEVFSDTVSGATGSMSAGTITQSGGGDTTSPSPPTGLGVN